MTRWASLISGVNIMDDKTQKQTGSFVYSLASSTLLLLLFGAGLLAGCTGGGSGSSSSSSAPQVKYSSVDLNMYPMNKTVCDPLTSIAPNPAISGGLKADLYYLAQGQTQYNDVESYINYGIHSDQTMFFTDLNVPTRNFTAGFVMQNDELVEDDAGNDLLEWFGIHFESVLQLAPNQPEGLYQFAVLSDDGAIFRVQGGDGWTTLISDDLTHPTKMGCSTITVNMTHQSTIPMQLDYFQGPRYQIALVLMMRPVSSSTPPAESMCGQNGNYLFFNPDNDSSPEPAYTQIVQDGWAPLTAQNFTLANQAVYNPCAQGQIPVISTVTSTKITANSFELDWTTDIASSSQVIFQAPGQAQSSITVADNILSTTHRVTVVGLTANTPYSIQAASISDTFGKATGVNMTVTTTR